MRLLGHGTRKYISDANYWKSPDQFKAFNIGLHGLLRSQSSYNIFVLGEPRSDIYGDQPFGGEATQGVERFSYNTINAEFTGISNFANFYTTLNQINLMIRRTNETDLLGEAEKNYYLGQAYGLRAISISICYALGETLSLLRSQP